MSSTVASLLAAIDQELSQGLTPEDIQKIGSVFGDGSSPGVLETLEGAQRRGLEGNLGPGRVSGVCSGREKLERHHGDLQLGTLTTNIYRHLLGKDVQLGSSGRGVY